MTDCVRVELGERSYDILVGGGLLAEAGRHMAERFKSRRAVIVTDETVAMLHLAALERSLGAAGFVGGSPLVLPAGEGTKDFYHLELLLERILMRNIERSTMLVALGGGVIGDITGFAAAVALRGLDFVQIPTTVLAQVDSSVGGKTGINSRHGKNLIGAFHQPRLVLADTDTLKTLPKRDLLAGYGEVVKYGLINDLGFFEWLEANGQRVVDGDAEAQIHAVKVSCAAKAAVVGADERESGDRALLNLGHTFGHALEAAARYGDKLRHGEGVAIGMALAFDLSVRLGLCPQEDADRVRAHLRAVGLPTSRADLKGVPWEVDDLIGHMGKDKKVKDGKITFILARGIGKSFIARDVATGDVRAVLEA
ncbi:MAG TPA: 3-dehydroquinate synthase [Azospirillaceae bacterium]|nr:3-dehydroquinate synthase [Azospirillaceae bacterium]